MGSFQENLDVVQGRMSAACDRCGRELPEVQLVAVSKKHGPERIAEAAECGHVLFGENKVQEAQAKIAMSPQGLTWHMIGHLQRNKVKRAVQLFDMIHSVDSIRLLEAVDAAAGDAGKVLPILIEVNVSGEGAKFGLSPSELPVFLEASTHCMHVDLMGLMTMPPWAEEAEKARMHFVHLRELFQECNDKHGFPMQELSMGMSHDFEIAIEEGATMIRVGTDLFGGR